MDVPHRKRSTSRATIGVIAALCAAGGYAHDDHGKGRSYSTALSGYNEVHFVTNVTPPALRGAVSTPASGRFKADIDERANVIDYELSYEGLTGTVTQAHIHFGQAHTVGGIVVWLCQSPSNPAPAAVADVTPACPQSGTVSGSIGADQVLSPTGQGLAAKDFDMLVRAIRAGAAYANVHTSAFPPGEIRGQLRAGEGHR